MRVFLDPKASAHSPVAELARNYPIRSSTSSPISAKPRRALSVWKNTHPFQRELWGRYWVFAHNGNLLNFTPALHGDFQPVGQTDLSGHSATCWKPSIRSFPTVSQTDAPFRRHPSIAADIGQHGEFNFLLSNGTCLFAHCTSRLAYIVRKAP